MPPPSLTFDAIGTHWEIDTAAGIRPELSESIAELVERFDRTWSRFRDDSVVTRMSRAAGDYPLPSEAPALFDLYRDLYEATDGAMTPLVGRALEQLGYDRGYSLRASTTVAPVPRWEDAVSWDGTTLHTVRPVVLDIGAAGKGYLVDLIGELLTAADVTAFTIDASGDILHRGDRPLRVALENPADTTRAIGVATLASGALCASAPNRRSWPGAHHIIDALTGRPTTEVIATWAVAADGLTADGLATALFFTDPARLGRRFDFEWVRMLSSGRIEHSATFPGELFA